jgi:hypothetical protein
MTDTPAFDLESIKGLPEEPWIADGPQVRLSTTVGSFWLATCSTESIAHAIGACGLD